MRSCDFAVLEAARGHQNANRNQYARILPALSHQSPVNCFWHSVSPSKKSGMQCNVMFLGQQVAPVRAYRAAVGLHFSSRSLPNLQPHAPPVLKLSRRRPHLTTRSSPHATMALSATPSANARPVALRRSRVVRAPRKRTALLLQSKRTAAREIAALAGKRSVPFAGHAWACQVRWPRTAGAHTHA